MKPPFLRTASSSSPSGPMKGMEYGSPGSTTTPGGKSLGDVLPEQKQRKPYSDGFNPSDRNTTNPNSGKDYGSSR